MESAKRRVYEILTDPPEGDRFGRGFSVFILALIAVNVLATILETVRSLGEAYPRFFHGFELFSVVVFTAEYVLRLWSCTSDPATRHPVLGRLKVASRTMPIVDLLAILPFYLQMLIPGLDLRFVRALRLFRIFRVFRAGRLAEAVRILAAVVRSRKDELVACFLVILLVVVLAGNVMYLLEHHAQSDRFSSVPAAMWWAVVTVTTIGYGDIVPVTTLGRILGAFMALLGIVMLALPVGVVGSGFLDEIQRRRAESTRGEGEALAASLASAVAATVDAAASGTAHPAPTVCPHCGQPVRS